MALAEVEALALASVWGWAREEARLRGERVTSARDILDSLNRHGVVRPNAHCPYNATKWEVALQHIISGASRCLRAVCRTLIICLTRFTRSF